MEVMRCYLYNNLMYNITETEEIHKLLEDDQYFENYIKNHANENEIVIPENTEIIAECSNFAWTAETTKLLITEYSKRSKTFRDPRKKKISLWREILHEFKEHGYNVSEAILDRKFRNMKHHYKTIIDNNKKSKTGGGRISWEYFDAFEAIFAEDKTIKSGPIISSLNYQSSNTTHSPASLHTVSPVTLQSTSSCSFQPQLLSQPLFISIPKQLSSGSTSTEISNSCSILDNTSNLLQPSVPQRKHTEEETPHLQHPEKISYSQYATEIPPLQHAHRTHQEYAQEIPERPAKKRKAAAMTALYSFRQELLRIEQRRVSAIEKLSDQLAEHNAIQRERNEILKKVYKIE